MARKTKENKLLFGFDDIGHKGATLETLGGKGYYLMDRHRMGVPIPPAKILSTELCRLYQRDPATVLAYLKNEAIPEIVMTLRKNNGDTPLFSVRSGAKVSMPGMMDTLLNVGLTKNTLPFWKNNLSPRAALDCRRRLLQMFGEVVCGIDRAKFEHELQTIKTKRRATEDAGLNEADLIEVITAYEKIFKKERATMPDTLEEQLLASCEAVLKSWDNPRAKEYRKIRGYSDDWGTAIVIQEMVFGNKDDLSCTGVLFTRNAALGTNEPMGEFLINAQGEDVVSGARTPEPIYNMKAWNPKAYDTLMSIASNLETQSKDVQDIEFTVQSGEVFILQTRTAQRSALAAVKIAVDMARSQLISKSEALSRVSLAQYEQLCSPMIAPTFNAKPSVTGLAASNGIATGGVVFTSDDAIEYSGDCVLLSAETTPDDLPGMHAAKGILTATGGVTSHAAVVARGMDKVCIVGASDIKFIKNKDGEVIEAQLGEESVKKGDTITLDGATGRVWVGSSIPVVPGGELPALLDFNDMIYEVFPVYRIVTDGRDLHQDLPMVFATYALDGFSESKIRDEIKSSLPYLKGILDLSTIEEYSSPEDAEILALGGSSKDDEVFEHKVNCALSFPDAKDGFRVYLGKRTMDYKERFEYHGFSVIPPGDLSHAKKNQSVFSIYSGPESDADAIWLAAKKGSTQSVVATSRAPQNLLLGLAEQRASGEDIQPVLAMSVPQILSSLKP